MKPLIFSQPDSLSVANAVIAEFEAETAAFELRRFPDGESFVRVLSDVQQRDAILVWNLHQPDQKMLGLYLLCCALREQGARRILLVAPYLPYMRQDVRFHPGETISAVHYARWLSSFVDALVTMDPHLHRIHALSEVYSVPSLVVPAAPVIANWLRDNVKAPLLIGPDEESGQWVSELAGLAGAPDIVLTKVRHGDRDVEVSVPEVERWQDKTPVLVDDIISTARTMIATVDHLKQAGMAAPICVGVHAIFAGDAYEALSTAGPAAIHSCNTIPHATNSIDIGPAMARGLRLLLERWG